MTAAKPIVLKGRPIAGGKVPLVCAPLVGRTHADLMSEAAIVARAKPDVIEWRVDFFSAIERTAAVIEAARDLTNACSSTPILLTKRSASEGGEPSPLGASGVVALYRAVCEAGGADVIDFEMSHPRELVDELKSAAKKSGVALVLSYHNFAETPPLATLLQKFEAAQALGADVAKVAVMPKTLDDVLVLLSATAKAAETLRIPLISMSMGSLGSLTRMCSWAFGSSLTFGVAASGSAPGQMAIEDVKAAIAHLKKAMQRG